MSYPAFVEEMIADAPPAIQERVRTVEAYNANCDAQRLAKIAETDRLRKEIDGEKVHRGHIQRELDRHGLPTRDGTDKAGEPIKIEYDPTEPMTARIKALTAELNKASSAPLPSPVDFATWLKTCRGQRLIEAEPVKLAIKKGESLADAYERAIIVSDGTVTKRSKIQRARLPAEEALENARNFVSRMHTQGQPSVYDLMAGGRFLEWSGKYSPHNPGAEPEFVKQAVGFNGNEPIEIVDPVKLFAAVAPDLLLGALENFIRAKADDSKAVSSADRPRLLAEAEEDIVAALRQEAEIGLECVRQRVPIMLRRNVHPAIYIGADWPAAKIVDFEI